MVEPIKPATYITSYGATPQSPSTTTTTTTAVPSSYDAHDHDTTDEDYDDEIEALDAAKGASTWRSWYRSLFKFFRGLGKFFLILAVGTVVLVLVLQYTLPSVDE